MIESQRLFLPGGAPAEAYDTLQGLAARLNELLAGRAAELQGSTLHHSDLGELKGVLVYATDHQGVRAYVAAAVPKGHTLALLDAELRKLAQRRRAA